MTTIKTFISNIWTGILSYFSNKLDYDRMEWIKLLSINVCAGCIGINRAHILQDVMRVHTEEAKYMVTKMQSYCTALK
jgi:hypothetical protein